MGLAVSAGAHLALAWLFAAVRAGLPPPPLPPGPTELVVFRDPLPDPPPALVIPPPRRPIVRPLAPAEPDGTSAPSTVDLEPPEVIPHDVPPRLLNGPDILAALRDGYPEGLPPEASETLVLLWLFIDTGGRVTKLRLQRSSGFEALDRLAEDVAPGMAYTPALHRGRRVAVWVAQRIRFQPPYEPDGTARLRGGG